MKKIIVLVAMAVIGCCGCYKEKNFDPRPILLRHTWQLRYQTTTAPNVNECVLATKMRFKKDGTGNFDRPIPCYYNQPTSVNFHWSVTFENLNMYQQADTPNSKKIVWRLGHVSDDTIRMSGVVNGRNEMQIYTPE